MVNTIQELNTILIDPTKENITNLFDLNGFIRFNLLYISPIHLKHFKEKIMEYGLVCWYFTESELVFKFKNHSVSFKGNLFITKISNEIKNENPDKTSETSSKIFSIELDFDPVTELKEDDYFLKDVENFLKNCDACFFMTYTFCIDTEILKYPLFQSIEFLANRK